MTQRKYLIGLGCGAFLAIVIALAYVGFLTDNTFLAKPLFKTLGHILIALLKALF